MDGHLVDAGRPLKTSSVAAALASPAAARVAWPLLCCGNLLLRFNDFELALPSDIQGSGPN